MKIPATLLIRQWRFYYIAVSATNRRFLTKISNRSGIVVHWNVGFSTNWLGCLRRLVRRDLAITFPMAIRRILSLIQAISLTRQFNMLSYSCEMMIFRRKSDIFFLIFAQKH